MSRESVITVFENQAGVRRLCVFFQNELSQFILIIQHLSVSVYLSSSPNSPLYLNALNEVVIEKCTFS